MSAAVCVYVSCLRHAFSAVYDAIRPDPRSHRCVLRRVLLADMCSIETSLLLTDMCSMLSPRRLLTCTSSEAGGSLKSIHIHSQVS